MFPSYRDRGGAFASGRIVPAARVASFLKRVGSTDTTRMIGSVDEWSTFASIEPEFTFRQASPPTAVRQAAKCLTPPQNLGVQALNTVMTLGFDGDAQIINSNVSGAEHDASRGQGDAQPFLRPDEMHAEQLAHALSRDTTRIQEFGELTEQFAGSLLSNQQRSLHGSGDDNVRSGEHQARRS